MNKILVVDDDELIHRSIKRTFADLSYMLLFAKNGEEALRKANELHPDLVIMDIAMPGMNGYEACRRLKENPATRCASIVFLSGKADLFDRLEVYNNMGDDFIQKPFNGKEMRSKVSVWLRWQNLNNMLSLVGSGATASGSLDSATRPIPMCCGCKCIRDNEGHWTSIEGFIKKLTNKPVSHSICPDCIERLYPDL